MSPRRAQVYTQTLDLFATLCRQRSWPVIRLDGSTPPGKRQKLVDQFNDATRDEFVFLLSSKAGGCGLNLIGGSRLILFDPDWNPATDLQAAARVWRDGQRKKVFVYRFLAAGSLEEKVFQRQLSKKGLQTIVVEEQDEATSLSTDELRNLFQYDANGTPSDTHDTLRCTRFVPAARVARRARAARAAFRASRSVLRVPRVALPHMIDASPIRRLRSPRPAPNRRSLLRAAASSPSLPTVRATTRSAGARCSAPRRAPR